MLREHLIAEVEAMLPGPTPEVRGVVDVRELWRRLTSLAGSVEPRLCPPPCRPQASRLDTHVCLEGRCCETRAGWWKTSVESPAGRTRGVYDGQAAALTGLIVLLAERPDLGELESPLRALASTLLVDGHATPPEDCGFGRRG